MTESNYICFGFHNMLPKTAENVVSWFDSNWCTIHSLDYFMICNPSCQAINNLRKQ